MVAGRRIVDAIDAVRSDADNMRNDLGEVAAVAEELRRLVSEFKLTA